MVLESRNWPPGSNVSTVERPSLCMFVHSSNDTSACHVYCLCSNLNVSAQIGPQHPLGNENSLRKKMDMPDCQSANVIDAAFQISPGKGGGWER